MRLRRSLFSFTVLLAITVAGSLSADATDPLVQKTLKILAGEWETVSMARNGKSLPVPDGGKRRVIIREDKFTVVLDGKTSGTGSFVLDPAKKPMAIDIKLNLSDGKEAKYLGVIEVSDQEHRICWADPGKDRPTKFGAVEGSGHTLATYRRVKQP